MTRRRLLGMAGLGLAAAVLYALGLALRYPLAEGLATPRHTWAGLAGATTTGFALHLAVYAAAALLYTVALRLALRAATPARDDPPPATATPAPRTSPPVARGLPLLLAVIVGGWLLASAALLLVAPGGEAHDVFDYLFRGRMLVADGASPLATVPSVYAGRPFYAYITWTDHVDTYGPLWEYASGGTAWATRAVAQATGHWVDAPRRCPADATACSLLGAYVLAYRLLAVGLAGVCGWIIYRLARRVDPASAPAALLAWLWNPLLLVSTAVGAHNDLGMLALFLASLWALERRRWLPALLLLVLAAHVKLTALAIAPLYGLWLVRVVGWRRALGYAAAAAVLGLGISWLLYAPLGGWATLPRMLAERQRYVALSFHHVAYRLLFERGADAGTLFQLTIRLPTLLYAAGAIGLAAWLVGWRRADPALPATSDSRVFWRAAVWLNLYYLLVGSFWFQPWYVLWVVAPAALLPRSRFTRSVLPWLSAGALAGNVVADYLPQLPGPPLERTGRVVATVVTTWLPAGLAALLGVAVAARAKRQLPG